MDKKVFNIAAVSATVFLLVIFALQWCMFQAYVNREVAWSPFLNGDANWYLGHSYIVFDSIMHQHKVPAGFLSDPSGVTVFLVSSFLYFFFGASRLAALSTNFILYVTLQAFMFYVIRFLTKSWSIAFAMLGLCLTALIPFQGDKVHPMLNITEYQRDFGAFCLFGIFISCVLFSDSFLKRKWSIVAGLIAGFMITFRLAMLFHLLGIYMVTLSVFFAIFLIKLTNKSKTIAVYQARVINGILSFLVMSVACSYSIYSARSALYHHYFVGKLVGPKDINFIKLYSAGVQDFLQQISFYPKMILGAGLGSFFSNTSIFICFFIAFFIVVSLILRMVLRKRSLGVMKNFQSDSMSRYFPVYNIFLVSIFLFISIIVPLFLLTAYPVRSGNVGLLVTSPLIMAVYILFTWFLNKFNISGNKILLTLKIVLATIILSLGIVYQVRYYSIKSLCSYNRKDYLEVARMYNAIIAVSKEADVKEPSISVDFMENYVLGCGEAITAYRYERAGELFRVRQKLGSDIGAEVKEDAALNLIRESDLVLLSVREEPLELRDPLYCDPLSPGMAGMPFSKSIKEIRPALTAYVNNNFIERGRYKIFNREVALYLKRQLSFRPIVIRASSQAGDEYSANSILDESNVIWHSKSPPTYPQWIEFEYKTPVIITQLTMQCQPGGARRAPAEFYLQGLDENSQWSNLLVISKASFTDKEELKSWPVENKKAFKCYRVYIVSNNGEPDFVTIARISFDYDISSN